MDLVSTQELLFPIGIIGIGFVGDALKWSLEQHNLESHTRTYDKYKNIGKFEDILDTKLVFLCLPTLYDQNSKEYDKSALYSVCQQLQQANYQGVVIIKSTIEPGTSKKLAKTYGLNIIHNPEFLSARTARRDLHNQKHIVLGKTSRMVGQIHLVKLFFTEYYPEAEISICTSWESESMKIFVNSFYAMKVQIFTEFYLLCQQENQDYSSVKDLMLKNKWINPMHTNIPGPDGQVSYGGACFPKDTQALMCYMEKLDSPHSVLKACIEERNLLRDE